MRGYTSLEQSKKLAEILPIESADMWWNFYSVTTNDTTPQIIHLDTPWVGNFNWDNKPDNVPCWSLAALSEFILPYIVDDDGNNYKFYLSKDGLDRWIAYYKSDDVSIHICEESDNMIDVILEMVYWLKKEEYI